jgi:hypothetical protein
LDPSGGGVLVTVIEEAITVGEHIDTFIVEDGEETIVLGDVSVQEDIVVEYVGIAVPGPRGLPGPPGDAVEALGREIEQIFPADPWDHFHNLPFEPNGNFYDTTGQTKLEPLYIDRYAGGMRVYWSDNGSRPTAGKAFYS